MATIKVKFRASSVDRKEGTLFYQVIHNRVVRQISTSYKLYPHEWNAPLSAIVVSTEAERTRREYLLALKESVSRDTCRIRNIIARFELSGNAYTAGNVVESYSVPAGNGGLIAFTQNLIGQLEQIGRNRTAETYTCALNSFIRFLGGDDILLDDIDSNLMMRYESHLKQTGICPNSSSFYMRNLRAIYNRAVEKELTLQRYPFKKVYTGIDKTTKRAVPLKIIRQIRDLDLVLNPSMDYARDMFMFSFYTRGMSFVDMAFLKKCDLKNGVLSYRRQKTGQQLFIRWEKPMQEIIDKYKTNNTPYLLPIIRKQGVDERRQYRNAGHLINTKLKTLGTQLDLPIPLTTYVARHAWASIAKSKNIPLSTISEAMGHDSELTTRIYLASLDTSVVDKANSLILKSLL